MTQANPAITKRFGADAGDPNAIHVIQGDQVITEDPNVVLTTILGSCVAACLRDPVAGVGGMNHFLLPGDSGAGGVSGAAERYGVHAMELLVNALLAKGASRSRLEAKLFGGAKTINGLSEVGSLNATFAEEFLRRERITVVGECLRGLTRAPRPVLAHFGPRAPHLSRDVRSAGTATPTAPADGFRLVRIVLKNVPMSIVGARR